MDEDDDSDLEDEEDDDLDDEDEETDPSTTASKLTSGWTMWVIFFVKGWNGICSNSYFSFTFLTQPN